MENRLGDILQAGMVQCGKTFFSININKRLV